MSQAELYASVQTIMEDPEASAPVRAAAEFFVIRPSAFVDLLNRCEANPTCEAEAAVTLMSRLFSVETQKSVEAKRDPHKFDEVALLLQSSEGLAERLKSMWHELQLTVSSCARALCMSLPQRASTTATTSLSFDSAGDSRLSTTLSQAKHALEEMHETVSTFCSESLKLLRYNSLGVELNNVIHLLVAKDELSRLPSTERQKLSAAVYRELQCKLERVWFGEFIGNMESSGLLPSETLRKLQDKWLSQWNLRKTIEQSTCFAELTRSQDIIRRCVKAFPVASKISDTEMSFFTMASSSGNASPSLSAVANGLGGSSRFEEIFLRQRVRQGEEKRAQSAGVLSTSSSICSTKQSQLLASRLRPRRLMYNTIQSMEMQ